MNFNTGYDWLDKILDKLFGISVVMFQLGWMAALPVWIVWLIIKFDVPKWMYIAESVLITPMLCFFPIYWIIGILILICETIVFFIKSPVQFIKELWFGTKLMTLIAIITAIIGCALVGWLYALLNGDAE